MDRLTEAVAIEPLALLGNEFAGTSWKREINVRDFLLGNVMPYTSNEAFLAAPTERTKALWAKVLKLMDEERAEGGTLDMDTDIVSTIVSHAPGYIDRELEQIVGLQTDKPLKRALMPFGGIRGADPTQITKIIDLIYWFEKL